MNNRNRIIYIALVLCVIALGLASRHFLFLPPFIYTYVGDMLWALMVFFIFGFLFPYKTTFELAVYSLCFAYLIEFSQLYHAPWIDAIRHTRLGGLVLGYGFLLSDLLGYVIGITLGVVAEHSANLARELSRKTR